MEPITILILAAVLTKMWYTRREERELYKQGITPPRIQHMLDEAKAGRRLTPPTGPGAKGYLRELWHDAWEDALDRHKRNRAAKKDGVYPPVRERVKGWWRWAKESWGTWKAKLTGDEPPTPVPAPTPEPPPPPAGTVTFDDDGNKVPITPTQPPAPAPQQGVPQPAPRQGGTMAGNGNRAAASDLGTNEAMRQNLRAQQQVAAEAAGHLAAYEAAQARLVALNAAGVDGVTATQFDRGATAAQLDNADLLPAAGMSRAAQALDAVQENAGAALGSLDRYRDSEDQVATEQIDPGTLAAHNS